MTTSTQLAPTPSDPPEPFTDRLRLAVAAYLARFKGSSREHIESDLRCYVSCCAVENVAFSPDGRTLAAGDLSGHIGLWNVTTGQRAATLTEGSLVNSVAFSPDGHTLAVGDDAGNIALWDMTTARETGRLSVADGSGSISSVAFSPDGTPWPLAAPAVTTASWLRGTRQPAARPLPWLTPARWTAWRSARTARSS
jgi:WD40 repeat protein